MTTQSIKNGLQRLIARVIEVIRRFSAKRPDYHVARQILGVDFITPEEVAKARPGVAYTYTDAQIAFLAERIPWAQNLRWCKDNGYAVMPVPPKIDFYSEDDQKFLRMDKVSGGWLAVRKTPVPDSTNKNWDEQNRLLSALEYVPDTAVMQWFFKTYFAVRGVRLFESIYVRTSSRASYGERVHVGESDDGRLHWNSYWADYCSGLIGLSSARNF